MTRGREPAPRGARFSSEESAPRGAKHDGSPRGDSREPTPPRGVEASRTFAPRGVVSDSLGTLCAASLGFGSSEGVLSPSSVNGGSLPALDCLGNSTTSRLYWCQKFSSDLWACDTFDQGALHLESALAALQSPFGLFFKNPDSSAVHHPLSGVPPFPGVAEDRSSSALFPLNPGSSSFFGYFGRS